MSPPHAGHWRGNCSPTRAMSLAQAIREVSWERGFACVPQQSPAACPASVCPPVGALSCFPTFPTARAGSRGLPAAARADPVGRFVPREHVADATDAAVGVTDHGKPLEREGGPGAIPQQVLERLKIAGHVAVDERDPDARIDGKPAVLPGEHVGGRSSVEQARKPEPPDHAATQPLGERGQIGRGKRPGRQELRRGVAACFVGSRHEDAVGHARVEVHMVVERRAEAVQERDGAEPRAGGIRRVGIMWDTGDREQEPLDLVEEV